MTILGLDVGLDQGLISLSDWRVIRAQGRRFAFIRCGEALGTVDPQFASNVAGGRMAGLSLGAYFVLHPDADPVEQAKLHFTLSKGLGRKKGELAPVCDTELLRGRTPQQVLEATIAWCDQAALLWGRAVTVYSYPNFVRQCLQGTVPGASLEGTNLWLAAYGVSVPPVLAPWKSVLFWQDTGGDEYRVPNGCPCDTDQFAGDEQAFADACEPSAQPVAPLASETT
jgi:lysozyme